MSSLLAVGTELRLDGTSTRHYKREQEHRVRHVIVGVLRLLN